MRCRPEAPQQRRLPVPRHVVLILAGSDPRERRFCERPTRDDPRRCRRDLYTEVTAGTCVFHALMLGDAYLFGNHIPLLAGLDVDLNQRIAVVYLDSIAASVAEYE